MTNARSKLTTIVEGQLDVRWFTTGQVAKRLGVAPRTVCKWVDSGRLLGFKLPGSKDRRIHPQALAEFEAFHGWDRARGAK